MLLSKTNSLQFIRSISKPKLLVMSLKRPFLIWSEINRSLRCICQLKTKSCLKTFRQKFRNFRAQMLNWPPSRANLLKPQVRWRTGRSLSIKLRPIRLIRTQKGSEWPSLLKDWEKHFLSMELREMKLWDKCSKVYSFWPIQIRNAPKQSSRLSTLNTVWSTWWKIRQEKAVNNLRGDLQGGLPMTKLTKLGGWKTWGVNWMQRRTTFGLLTNEWDSRKHALKR